MIGKRDRCGGVGSVIVSPRVLIHIRVGVYAVPLGRRQVVLLPRRFEPGEFTVKSLPRPRSPASHPHRSPRAVTPVGEDTVGLYRREGFGKTRKRGSAHWQVFTVVIRRFGSYAPTSPKIVDDHQTGSCAAGLGGLRAVTPYRWRCRNSFSHRSLSRAFRCPQCASLSAGHCQVAKRLDR